MISPAGYHYANDRMRPRLDYLARFLEVAAQAIRAGDANLLVAGGMESMSRAPYLVNGRLGEMKFGNQTLTDALLYDGLWDPFENWGMGMAAEFIADECRVTRAAMDEFALGSHQKAVMAQEAGRFKAELVPVQIPGREGEVTIFDTDEGPRKDARSNRSPN